MKHVTTAKLKAMFRPVLESASVQAAIMNLKPGQASGEFGNEHPRAEQWVYVVEGEGVVKTTGRSVKVRAGSIVLIEKREKHQVINTASEGVMRTLNLYAPPAYTTDGEDVRRGAK